MIIMSCCVDVACASRPVAGFINDKRMDLGIFNYKVCMLHITYNKWILFSNVLEVFYVKKMCRKKTLENPTSWFMINITLSILGGLLIVGEKHRYAAALR